MVKCDLIPSGEPYTLGRCENAKVPICKRPEKILIHVTALISEQLTESSSDDSSLAKLGKRILRILHCSTAINQNRPLEENELH